MTNPNDTSAGATLGELRDLIATAGIVTGTPQKLSTAAEIAGELKGGFIIGLGDGPVDDRPLVHVSRTLRTIAGHQLSYHPLQAASLELVSLVTTVPIADDHLVSVCLIEQPCHRREEAGHESVCRGTETIRLTAETLTGLTSTTPVSVTQLSTRFPGSRSSRDFRERPLWRVPDDPYGYVLAEDREHRPGVPADLSRLAALPVAASRVHEGQLVAGPKGLAYQVVFHIIGAAGKTKLGLRALSWGALAPLPGSAEPITFEHGVDVMQLRYETPCPKCHGLGVGIDPDCDRSGTHTEPLTLEILLKAVA